MSDTTTTTTEEEAPFSMPSPGARIAAMAQGLSDDDEPPLDGPGPGPEDEEHDPGEPDMAEGAAEEHDEAEGAKEEPEPEPERGSLAWIEKLARERAERRAAEKPATATSDVDELRRQIAELKSRDTAPRASKDAFTADPVAFFRDLGLDPADSFEMLRKAALDPAYGEKHKVGETTRELHERLERQEQAIRELREERARAQEEERSRQIIEAYHAEVEAKKKEFPTLSRLQRTARDEITRMAVLRLQNHGVADPSTLDVAFTAESMLREFGVSRGAEAPDEKPASSPKSGRKRTLTAGDGAEKAHTPEKFRLPTQRDRVNSIARSILGE
jgi:hypothetical protein